MTTHLLLKFQYCGWNVDPDANIRTIDVHQEIIKNHGACWWGATSAMSQEKLELIRGQIRDGIETKILLYATWVPKSIHRDGIAWFQATLKEISLGQPKERELIPAYYRDVEVPIYFKLGNISPISFPEGSTPKVPGQAALRYVSYSGSFSVEKLFSVNDPTRPLCLSRNESKNANIEADSEHSKPLSSDILDSNNTNETSLQDKIIDLQDELLSAKQQIIELNSYRDYYNKLLTTDYLFSSEKFLESWVQENIHKVFPELQIIDRQLHAKWPDGKFGKLDLLAFNKDTGGLTILEIKTRKRSTKSGFDQYMRYSSWLKRNYKAVKNAYADLPINDEIAVDFIILSDFVNEEMKTVCKDHGIKLIHIFGGLGFDRVS